jgi:hypothetical protein
MAYDTNIRKFAAVLTIPAVLLAIGAGYERGGLTGLRDLGHDLLRNVGLAQDTPAPAPPATLTPDEVFWLSIKDSRAPGLYEEFLKKFPGSPHTQAARAKLENLQKVLAPAAQDAPRRPMGHTPGMMMAPSRGG